uniref:Uncharacterized protein n=1 Tax=Klebsiella sp. T5-5 TaxID=1778875 RepID=A0A126QG19_9ENTR|nr:hypothetical protein [Klebsiella sp. T5-5]
MTIRYKEFNYLKADIKFKHIAPGFVSYLKSETLFLFLMKSPVHFSQLRIFCIKIHQIIEESLG